MKITLKDGSVFEGTAQEYAELVKLGEGIAESKDEYVPKVGDIVVITGNTNGSINKVGDIGRVGERLGSEGVRVHVPGKPSGLFGGNYTRFDEMRPATEEEKKQYKQAEKFAKLGRKPGEFKKGDIVRVKWLLGKGYVDEIAEIKSGPEGAGCGGNYKLNDGNKETLGEDLELIAPVESRVDLDD